MYQSPESFETPAPVETPVRTNVFYGVADYLEKYGWIQNDIGEHGGPRCIGGAIISVVGLDNNRALCDAVEAFDTELGGDLVTYNNADERTAPEVIARLRSAGARAVLGEG